MDYLRHLKHYVNLKSRVLCGVPVIAHTHDTALALAISGGRLYDFYPVRPGSSLSALAFMYHYGRWGHNGTFSFKSFLILRLSKIHQVKAVHNGSKRHLPRDLSLLKNKLISPLLKRR